MKEYPYSFSKLQSSENDHDDPKHLKVGFWSRVTVWWMNNIMRQGNQKPLGEGDLFAVDDLRSSKVMAERLQHTWSEELQISRSSGAEPNLVRAVYRIGNLRDYATIAILPVISCSMILLQAVFLAMILRDMRAYGRNGIGYSCVYISGIFLSSVVEFVGDSVSTYKASCTGIQARSALTALIYNKILSTSMETLAKSAPGYVMNLITRDVSQFDNLFLLLPWVFAAPINIIAAFTFLWWIIGVGAVPSLLYALLVIAHTLGLYFPLKIFRRKALRISDKRMRIILDVVSGIRQVKANVWEHVFHSLIQKTRKRELHFLKFLNYIQATLYALSSSYAVAGSMLTFTPLVVMGTSKLTPEDIFTTIIVLTSVRKMISGFKDAIDLLSRVKVSLKRIKRFLYLPDKNTVGYKQKPVEQSKTEVISEEFETYLGLARSAKNGFCPSKKCAMGTEPCIVVSQLHCHWAGTKEKFLSDINLHLHGKQLVLLTGGTGCGKSCLLQSIIGEIPPSFGHVQVSGSTVYVSQTPWIFSGTISENILFGKDFDEERFDKVVNACLLQDLVTRSKRDNHQVGERGVCLSSGLQAQVNLARALYADADIYLLDEPFREFDPITGRHIFKQCIQGLLADRLCVLATKQLQYTPNADTILILRTCTVDGSATAVQELRASGHFPNVGGTEGKANMKDDIKLVQTALGPEPSDEDRMVGEVSVLTYWKFFRAGASSITLFVLLWVMSSGSLLRVALKTWYAYWSDMSLDRQRELKHMAIFSGLATAFVLVTFVGAILFQWIILNCTKNLHHFMTTALVRSHVTFFDTNPAGRTLNRFCSDVAHLGSEMQTNIIDSFITGLELSGTLFILVYSNPIILLALGPYFSLCVWLWYYHLDSARELKRIEYIKKTPLFEQIAEALRGIVTIRTYGNQDLQLETFHRRQEVVNQATFLYTMSCRWVTVRMEFLGVLVMAVAAYSVILVSHDDAAFIGLSISQALTFIVLYRRFLRVASYMESHMISVERVLSYTKFKPENGYDNKDYPPKRWPREGSLKFQDVSLVYHPGGPKALRHVSATINSGEKIGIVGRNGAGKSSLLSALCRMSVFKGQIFIDGININSINLPAARSAVTVIPQNPVMFNGSLRLNLDPESAHSDIEIWNVLSQVQLADLIEKRTVESDKFRLTVTDYGANFSVGEKQLICLARALLRNCKIVVFDEATSCVDQETDELLHRVLQKDMLGRTLLTISRRLKTLRDCDKIIVLDKGRIVEFDKPQNLLEREDSMLTKLLVK